MALDVRPEERVLLVMCDGPEMIAAFFGAIKIGAIPVPLNTRWTTADYEFVLRDSSARVIIVSAELLDAAAPAIETCTSLRHVVVLGQDGAGRLAGAMSFETLVASASPALEPEPTSPDAPAFWLYSSGSTGQPKGCVHLQHDMTVCADAYARGVLGIHEHDRCFSVAKLFFAYGLGNSMYFPLRLARPRSCGPARSPHRRSTRSSSVTVPRCSSRCRPTTRCCWRTPCRSGSSTCPASGRPCLPEKRCPALFDRFRNRFGIEILDGIGSTEVLHIFISNQPGRVRPGSSGVVVPGYEARLVDEHGQSVPTGELGDLVVRGDSTCASYWNRHEQTKDTISGHWIRTGESTARTTTASSGLRDAQTTCSRWAASG